MHTPIACMYYITFFCYVSSNLIRKMYIMHFTVQCIYSMDLINCVIARLHCTTPLY